MLEPGSQQVDLVWASPLEPEAVRFFVELRTLDARASHEIWSGFVDVSSVRLPLPPGGSKFGLASQCSGEERGELRCVRLGNVHDPAVVEFIDDLPLQRGRDP